MLAFIKSIRGHVYLYMISIVSIFSIANYFIIKLIVSPRHLQIEQKLAQQEIKRFTEALLREEENLVAIGQDWAAWDDTYHFVQKPNLEYISSNLSDASLINLDLNLLYIFRLDGTLVWGRLLDLNTEKEMFLEEFPPAGLPRTHPLLHHPGVDSSIIGLVETARGPMLIGSYPIVTSEDQGPVVGTLMFGRILTEQVMIKLSKQINVKFRLIDLEDRDCLIGLPAGIASLGKNIPFLYHVIDEEITVYHLLSDYQEKPEWLIEAQTDRLISLQTKQILSYVLLSDIAMGFVSFFLFLLIYRYQFRTAASTFRGLIDQSLPPQIKERRKYPLLRSFSTNEFSKLSSDLRTVIAGFEQSKEQQKNIINKNTSSLRQLNSKLVEEIKERLKVEEDLSKIQQSLEKQVEQRTGELREINTALQGEIERRKEKETELIKHRKRLRMLSSELMKMEEKGRRQLATELHDQIGQSLSAVKMYVDGLIASTSGSTNLDILLLISSIVDGTVADIRTFTFELSPPILYELGLSAALEWLAEEFQKKYSFEISLNCDACPNCSSALLALLFRTIRELLINVVRHAGVDTAEVEVRFTGETIHLTVIDNGCGIENEDTKNRENASEGFGLFSIRERINNIGGIMVIDSQINRGTAIILTLPLKEACPKDCK